MTFKELVDYVNELNVLVSDFQKNRSDQKTAYLETGRGNHSTYGFAAIRTLLLAEYQRNQGVVAEPRHALDDALIVSGNLSERQMAVTCEELKIGKKDRFIDIGCGYGQLMCTVAALTEAKESAGIEFQDHIYNA
ncbi:hypothetical protein B9Z55_021887 [Caenorhabditis nigoni]|uniref:Histone-lysine N-methyltransferase, H3 lysine-79 specific n=1 Tax=Caenorhabditis nigoni TaxID=1611254 RepID=A0A2G5TU37_9PELO|nr:hypothetical protein B9Z55_021887 [Caenorhabditis nigoni]